MYKYSEQRKNLFTEEGQAWLLKMHEKATRLCKVSGAVRMDKLHGMADTSWDDLACMDRLVELGYFLQVTGPHVRGQDRVFVMVKYEEAD